jgi:hypothetical protein
MNDETKNRIKCFLGFHDWHKYRYPGARIQSYGQRICERCGVYSLGFARKNHPFFRKTLGVYSHDKKGNIL